MLTFLFYACALTAALVLFVVAKYTARFIAAAVFQAFEVGHPSIDKLNYHVSGVVGALAAPVVLFLAAASIAAVVAPPPSKLTYVNAVNEDATFWQRNSTWVALNTGWLDTKVTNRFLYTKAEVSSGDEQVTLVGLPVSGKWYRVNAETYKVL